MNALPTGPKSNLIRPNDFINTKHKELCTLYLGVITLIWSMDTPVIGVHEFLIRHATLHVYIYIVYAAFYQNAIETNAKCTIIIIIQT